MRQIMDKLSQIPKISLPFAMYAEKEGCNGVLYDSAHKKQTPLSLARELVQSNKRSIMI